MIREIDRGLGARLGAPDRRLEPRSSRRAEPTPPPSWRASTPSSMTCTPPASRSSSRPATCPAGRPTRTGGRTRRPATPRDRRPSTRSATAPSGTTATSPSSSRAATRAGRRRSSAGTSPTCGRTSIRSAPPATPTSPLACTCACSRRSTPAWRAPIPACASSPAPPPPSGLDDIYRTSPQRFARFLQRAHAGRYFDVYSHHPYTPGGSIYAAPDTAAQRPLAHGDALQPAHAAAPLPRQALLPHGVRLQHQAQPHVRPLRRRGRSRPATSRLPTGTQPATRR